MASCLVSQSGQNPSIAATTASDSTMIAICTEAFECHAGGQIAEAIRLYRRVLSLAPKLPVIRNNLGHALAQLGQLDAATIEYQQAIALKPDYAEALCNWGVALSGFDRADEAEAKFRQAIAVNPGFAGAYHNLGVLLKERGRLDEASRAVEQAIDLAPRKAAYYEHLGAVRPYVAGERYLTSLESLAHDPILSVVEQIHVHFALANAYKDIGAPDAAFEQLLAGNRLKRQHIAYDEAATLARMDRTREVFTRDFIQARENWGDPSPKPVFIVGMPRSGTSLIEQILASHPLVHGAGELRLFDQAAGSIRDTMSDARPFPEMMREMPAKYYRTLAALYLSKLTERALGATRITDKMTANFLFAGLIHLALPNATIIHAVRDPIDTCVSCFFVNFGDSLIQTYDLAELGRYYRHYQMLMEHWHSVLPPGRIIDVHYEDLIGDLDSVARRVVAHCGLPWDSRCLDYRRAERSVRTASARQVRQPIYTSAIGRWRKYERFLEPLLAALGPLSTAKQTENVNG
jgi:tetratricopeptide (TPR) repeat protein